MEGKSQRSFLALNSGRTGVSLKKKKKKKKKKSVRMRWAGYVACMGARRGMHTGFWWGNLREGDHFEDPGLDGRVILKWIFRRDGKAWTGLIWLRVGMRSGLL